MKKRANIEFHFKQRGRGCGLCVINVVLKMYGLVGTIFPFSPKKGISSKKILIELRNEGLIAQPKDITVHRLEPRSIIWYPKPADHYVVVGKVVGNWALIFDGDKKEPYWMRLSDLTKKWYRWYHGRWCGWVIETKMHA